MELATVDKLGRLWRIHHNAQIEDVRHSIKDLKLTMQSAAALVNDAGTVAGRASRSHPRRGL
jgi:hypothetical protein